MGYHAGSRYTRYGAKMVRARKEHECDTCRRIIQKGEIYEASTHPIYDFHGPPIGSHREHRCSDCLAWEDPDRRELWRRFS